MCAAFQKPRAVAATGKKLLKKSENYNRIEEVIDKDGDISRQMPWYTYLRRFKPILSGETEREDWIWNKKAE